MTNTSTRLRSFGLCSFTLIMSAACSYSSQFQEPEIDEPHATAEVRIIHHTAPGPMRRNRVILGGNAVPLSQECATATVDAPCARPLRLSPGPSMWRFATDYFHLETRTRTVPHTVTETYSCGTITVGVYPNQTTQPQTCTRSRTEYRTETYSVRIPDGRCYTEVSHDARLGASYLIYYEFYASEHCSVRCFRRHREQDGTMRMVPCGAAEELLPAADNQSQATTPQ
jgi:hypothetical protein